MKGKKYCLKHLKPEVYIFTLLATPNHPSKEVKLLVRYSTHCYSVASKNGDGDFEDERKKPRNFCPKRYVCSKYLPNIFSNFIERICFTTTHANYITIELFGNNNQIEEYEIYFNIKFDKKTKMILIFVESAYVRDPEYVDNKQKNRSSRQKIKAQTLIGKILRGEKIKRL